MVNKRILLNPEMDNMTEHHKKIRERIVELKNISCTDIRKGFFYTAQHNIDEMIELTNYLVDQGDKNE